MRGAILHGPHDVRLEQRDDPTIIEPTDAIIRLSATCVCGSDLWPYRGTDDYGAAAPMGHEYVGIVEAVGADVTTIRPGQFVIGSFFASDNTCEICQAGYQSSCIHRQLMGQIGTQAEYARIPLADGTLVATPDLPSADLIPSYLAASDVADRHEGDRHDDGRGRGDEDRPPATAARLDRCRSLSMRVMVVCFASSTSRYLAMSSIGMGSSTLAGFACSSTRTTSSSVITGHLLSELRASRSVGFAVGGIRGRGWSGRDAAVELPRWGRCRARSRSRQPRGAPTR